MSFSVKAWKDYPDTSTPINAAALQDMETRLSAYTDTEISDFFGLSIPTSESTTSTSYTTLATPDQVSITLPALGLVEVWYQALWQNTVGGNARGALFLGSNQLVITDTGGPPVNSQATGNTTANIDSALASSGEGLTSQNDTSNQTEGSGTGQIVGNATAFGIGGGFAFWATAGTYTLAVKFKNNSAGTMSVSKRHLWVRVATPT